MRKKLWEKTDSSLNEEIEKFEVGKDFLLDLKLAPFDVYGSAAHARMLQKIGLLTDSELDDILKGLKSFMGTIQDGSLTLHIEEEDIHTKVENVLSKSIGAAGKKLHTARSRNDQVLLDTRLYCKEQLFILMQNILILCETLLDYAQQYEFVPMPGYTHMQIAMPSSVGMWISAFVENFLDELHLIEAVFQYNDMNPLGSGAAYGVSIDIDRNYTTDLLGFERLQKNSLYCGNSRGKAEAHILNALSAIALILNKIATDLLLFTTQEFQFFNIDPAISTGSSIMPQKKNLDVLELIRGRTHVILGNESQIKHIIANIPSGYNKDYQETKRLLIESFEVVEPMLKVVGIVFQYIIPNEDRLKKAHPPEIYATDAAYKLVKEGMPFRDAYRHIGDNIDQLSAENPVENIKAKKHVGATGNLELDQYRTEITNMSKKWEQKRLEWYDKLEKLL